MNIGFDAKRAFHNGTGLGHYSRTLIQSLSDYFPQHKYYLFNPNPSSTYKLHAENMHEILPQRTIDKLFTSAWRSNWVKNDLKKNHIDLYHGLSHEIPIGIHKTRIKSVVTIHDLIHERYPEQYKPLDRKIYSKKFQYACLHADKIIAISEQTKKDIIELYQCPEDKITVCYQSCNPAFSKTISDDEKKLVIERYDLPEQYFLSVGSIIERKNLLNICKAINLLKGEMDIPLLVIGDGGTYKKLVKDYMKENNLENKIIFLSESESARGSSSYKSGADFPAIFQSAIAMIYPSFYEGFGIPVLEALCSRLPVITSNVSCLPEAGGDAAYYVDPRNASEIATAMKNIYTDAALAKSMVEKGWHHAQRFTQQKAAEAVLNVYKSIW